MLGEIVSGLTAALPFIVGVGGVGGILASGYVKASPDTALIISGLRKTPKVLIGKAGIKIPFLERKDELNLQLALGSIVIFTTLISFNSRTWHIFLSV